MAQDSVTSPSSPPVESPSAPRPPPQRDERRREREQAPWVPKTRLGELVATGKITSLEEIFESGQRVKEGEIVKKLLPDIKSNVVSVGIVQKQTDAGEVTKFAAVVAVGNEAGWFGVGRGKSAQMRSAIDKATTDAYLNIIPVKLGCGRLGMQGRQTSLCSLPNYRKRGECESGDYSGTERSRPGGRRNGQNSARAGRCQRRVDEDLRLHQHHVFHCQRCL